MAERFSQKNLRVRPSSDEEKIVTNAKKHFEKTLVEISGEIVGSVAALEHPTKNKKLNYGEIFLRDNVPVMIYLITQKRYEIVKKFLSCLLYTSPSPRDSCNSRHTFRNLFTISYLFWVMR